MKMSIIGLLVLGSISAYSQIIPVPIHRQCPQGAQEIWKTNAVNVSQELVSRIEEIHGLRCSFKRVNSWFNSNIIYICDKGKVTLKVTGNCFKPADTSIRSYNVKLNH